MKLHHLLPPLAVIAGGVWLGHFTGSIKSLAAGNAVLRGRIEAGRAAAGNGPGASPAAQQTRSGHQQATGKLSRTALREWRELAGAMLAADAGGMPDLRLNLRMRNRLEQMSAADVLATFDELAASDISPEGLAKLQGLFFDVAAASLARLEALPENQRLEALNRGFSTLKPGTEEAFARLVREGLPEDQRNKGFSEITHRLAFNQGMAGAAGFFDAIHATPAEREALVAEAAALGLAVEGTAAGDQIRHRRAARPVEDREAVVRDFVRELVALLKDLKAGQADVPNESALARITDIVERLYQLDAGQVQMLLDEVRASPEIDGETRRNVIGFAIVSLADSHPAAAMAVFDAAQDLFTGEDARARRGVVDKLLGTWAAIDPVAALDWMRGTGARDAELVTDKAKRTLIAGVARKNPALAFHLMNEPDLQGCGLTASQIVDTARTPVDQRAMLDALRGLADGSDRDQDVVGGMRTLGTRMAGQGYDATIAWLSGTQPSQQECLSLAQGLDYQQTMADSGRWMEWMGDHLPPQKVDGRVMELMANWATHDYQAAGGWLANAPAGPAKQAAVGSYVITVAPYDPATAAQWAETLPAGGTRQALLQQVNVAWNRLDPEAAARFAQKHGLTP